MIIKDENYIYCIVAPYGEEEKEIHELCKNPPIAPDGYEYKLTVNKTWELCKKGASKETAEDEVTEADYQDALREMGVKV